MAFFYISRQGFLSMYASRRTTGIVLDSGDGKTQIAPVYGVNSISENIQVEYAGLDLTYLTY